MGFHYSLKFHSVGQGLFSSGRVNCGGNKIFNFVYDCGTSSQQKLINKAINSLSFDDDNIDLLTISHFDKDHISGLKMLLSKYRVKTLLIPYLSFEQRIFIAFSNNIGISSSLMKFYLNPKEYLLSNFENKIGKIILVRSKQSDDNFERFDSDNTQILDFDSMFNEKTQVEELKFGKRLTYKGEFEFIPYNDASLNYKSNRAFQNKVNKEREILTSSTTANDIQASLARMRDCYNKTFGNNPTYKNIISLFLFCGPCVYNDHMIDYSISREANSSKYFCLEYGKSGILFTGDGYLDTKARLKGLIDFMGHERISRIGCLQVMHHGARGAWHQGVAKVLAPSMSVFSSNPEHKSLKHPHAEVVRDFLPYNPMQVDKENSIEFFFW